MWRLSGRHYTLGPSILCHCTVAAPFPTQASTVCSIWWFDMDQTYIMMLPASSWSVCLQEVWSHQRTWQRLWSLFGFCWVVLVWHSHLTPSDTVSNDCWEKRLQHLGCGLNITPTLSLTHAWFVPQWSLSKANKAKEVYCAGAPHTCSDSGLTNWSLLEHSTDGQCDLVCFHHG